MRRILLLVGMMLCAVSAYAGMPGTKQCGFDDYRSCISLQCIGDGGPAGETPCCKPPPYRPQICKSVRLWLPTTVLYPAPESVYGPNGESGFSVVNYISGNYISIKVNPLWVVMYAYGYSACSPYVEMTSPTSEKKSFDSRSWTFDVSKGLVQVLPNSKAKSLGTRSGVDDRLFESDFVLFSRASNDVASSALKWSLSPFAKQCQQVGSGDASMLARYPSGKAYSTFGKFLNRYATGDFTSLDSKLDGPKNGMPGTNELYDSCSEDMKAWKTRPVYYIWSFYWFSIHKGQIQGCQ